MFLQAFLQASLVLIIFSASDEAKEHVGAAASEASTRLTHTHTDDEGVCGCLSLPLY